MAFAVAKNEWFAVARASPEDGADTKATEDLRPSCGAMRPKGLPGGLRRSCHPGKRARQIDLSSVLRRGAILPDLPSHLPARAARADVAGDKADHTAKH